MRVRPNRLANTPQIIQSKGDPLFFQTVTVGKRLGGPDVLWPQPVGQSCRKCALGSRRIIEGQGTLRIVARARTLCKVTLAVLWYRERLKQLWCAADSRISREQSVMTDRGPKILPVPVACWKIHGPEAYALAHSWSFGFAFAGSTLAALSTHALATACTQNLTPANGDTASGPPCLASIAELFRVAGEDFIRDISSRATGSANPNAYHFEGFIFGFCPATNKYQAFRLAPNTQGSEFRMLKSEMLIQSHVFHPIGIGSNRFVELVHELDCTGKPSGVIPAFREMLKRELVTGVGGHFQIGVAHKNGFRLVPILNLAPGPLNRTATFLGWNVDTVGPIDGYRVGYQAFSPDID